MTRISTHFGLFLAAILVVGVTGCASHTAGTAQQPVSPASSVGGTGAPGPTQSASTDHNTPSQAAGTSTTPAQSVPETSVPSVTDTTPEPPPTGPVATTSVAPTGGSDTGSDIGSASAAVAPFLAAARASDHKISAAAAAVNSSSHAQSFTFDQGTVDLVAGARPSAVGAAIPAGLDPALEKALLLVYSDLESRYAALHGESCVQVGTFAAKDLNEHCFTEGHAAAVRTDGDLAAAEQLAASTAAPQPAQPGSPAAAEPAVRVAYINGHNEGCGSHGGFVATGPIDVHFADAPASVDVGTAVNGQANGVNFTATYSGGTDWTVRFRAC